MSNVRSHRVTSAALLGLYWEPRAQSLSESTSFLLGAFGRLAIAGYAAFYRKGRSLRGAKAQPLVASKQSVESLLSLGVNRKDLGNELIPELGRSFGLWSGGAEEFAYEFSGLLGSTSLYAKNCLVLRLPSTGPLALSNNEARIKELFKSSVEVVQPQEAVVCEASAIAWQDGRLSLRIPAFLHWSSET